MKNFKEMVAVLILASLAVTPAFAGKRNFQPVLQPFSARAVDGADASLFEVAQSDSQYPVSASEAANIAKDSMPGAKVLKVQLLPSGVYAVTLKEGGNVSRVMVDATTGSIV